MEGFFMRNWRMVAVVGMLMVPWIGTLVWMQVTGEAAEAAYEGKLLEADGTRMDGSGGGFLEKMGNFKSEAGQDENKVGNYNINGKENSNKVVENGNNTGDFDGKVGIFGNRLGADNPAERDSGMEAGTGEGSVLTESGIVEAGGEISDQGAGQSLDQGAEPGAAGSNIAVGSRKILVERGQVKTYMSVEDYLPGVLVCQVPDHIDEGEYDQEVWNCQAVIARTYICRLMEGRSEIHEEELDLDYLGENRSLRGSSRDWIAQRLEVAKRAVEETSGVVMKYEGRYILPLFHEMSAGRTRQGHADFPYIQSVDSSRDVKRSTYLRTMEWTKTEFAAKISQIPDAAPVTSTQLPQEIQTVEKDDAGYLLQMKIGARTYTGDEIRWALGLPSSCFSLEGDGDMIRARVKGSGHGYGLSQAGADSMAREGWGYKEILQYYYKNISLISE